MKSIFAAAFLVATVATFGIADAMPLAPPATGVNADVIQVAGICDPTFCRFLTCCDQLKSDVYPHRSSPRTQ